MPFVKPEMMGTIPSTGFNPFGLGQPPVTDGPEIGRASGSLRDENSSSSCLFFGIAKVILPTYWAAKVPFRGVLPTIVVPRPAPQAKLPRIGALATILHHREWREWN